MLESASVSGRGLRCSMDGVFNNGVSCIVPTILYVVNEYVVITEADARAIVP